MNVSFHAEARDEFLAAVEYYEGCQEGLGQDFCFEVRSAIGRILQFPKAWPSIRGEVRRCLTNRFPYGVLYSIEEDGLLILAVMHLHRDPDHWKHRA